MYAVHASLPQHSSVGAGMMSPPDFYPPDLLTIFEPSIQVCMVERPANHEIRRYLEHHAHSLVPGVRLMLDARLDIYSQLEAQLSLVKGQGRQALLTDMAQLATVYADLLDCPRIGLRLEVVSQAMCPKFHVDRTGIRMLCTYLGAGTEWLDDRYVNRAALHARHESLEAFHQQLIMHPDAIQQAPAFAIVLLKGSLWQGNTGGGIVHRSPAIVPDKKRVLLALDAVW